MSRFQTSSLPPLHRRVGILVIGTTILPQIGVMRARPVVRRPSVVDAEILDVSTEPGGRNFSYSECARKTGNLEVACPSLRDVHGVPVSKATSLSGGLSAGERNAAPQ